MAHTYMLRTRFAKDIVTEFLPPASARSRSPRSRTRVIILCDGMPSVPHAQAFAEWLSKKGFWVFSPRYRGSWESGGVFLRRPPDEDVIDVISGFSKTFTSLYDGKKFKLKPDEVFVIGASFGGAAALLASRDPRVKKVVAVSPVVDWRAPSKEEPFAQMEKFTREAFGDAYRCGPRAYAKLKRGKFYSPVHHEKDIDGAKLFVVHAKDDGVVRPREVAKFAKGRNAKFILLKKGGHLSARAVVRTHWKQIAKFFKSD